MSEKPASEREIALDALIRPGDMIGPYRIVRAFPHRGGMAQIFEVEVWRKYRRPDVPTRLAMKVARPEYEAALSAEADFLPRFAHPHVVRIYPLLGYHKPVFAAREQFPFGWGWYYTMELVEGGSLAMYLFRTTLSRSLFRAPPADTARPLSLLVTLGIARQMIAALEQNTSTATTCSTWTSSRGTSSSDGVVSNSSAPACRMPSSATSGWPGICATPAWASWGSPPRSIPPQSKQWRRRDARFAWMPDPTSSLWEW